MTRGSMVVMGLALGLWPAVVSAELARAVIESTKEGPPILGTAELNETEAGLEVQIQLFNVEPGQHGLHIHQYGDCSEGGNAAGGHFNPDDVPHGFLPKDGLAKAHPGDMGNIEIGPDGSGSLTVVLPEVTLSVGPYSVGGRAIVLHEQLDDFGQPTGNAGGRIGCGPIVING